MTGKRAEILVLGLGNDILGDDAVGLCAAREFAAEAHPGIDVLESSEAGFALLDILAGYRTVVIVDAIHTGTVPAGTLLEYSRADFHRLAGHSPHYVGLPELFSIAERLDLPFPADVRIVAMEIDDPWTLGEGLSPAVARELPLLVRRVAELTDLSTTVKKGPLRPTPLSC
jgi:hydrogenase maturation protease